MKFLQVKAATDALQALGFASVDIVKVFKASGIEITTKDCRHPVPLWDQATITQIGDVVRCLLPVQVKYKDEADIDSGWLDGTMFISVLVGSDLSVLVEGSW